MQATSVAPLACAFTFAYGQDTVRSCHSQEDYDRARGLVKNAARSGSYLYPIKVSPLSGPLPRQPATLSDVCSQGIAYFMTHSYVAAHAPDTRGTGTRRAAHLLSHPQGTMEAVPFEAGAHAEPVGRRGGVHVLLHVHSPAGHHGPR